MCVIIYKPLGTKISDKILEQCHAHNSDGAGFAYYDDDGKIAVEKGFFDVMTLKESLLNIDYEDVEMILHFRFATAGAVNKDQCHPFGISRNIKRLLNADTSSVIFHNGMLPHYSISESKSDTAIFTRSTLAELKSNAARIRLLESVSGKYALMTPTGIELIGEFHESDGLLFSNLHWKPIPQKIGYYSANKYGKNRYFADWRIDQNLDDDYTIIED